MLERLIEYDQELFLYLNNLGNEHWDWLWLMITHKFGVPAISIYVILLFLLYRTFGAKGLFTIVVGVAVMITCTDQLANLFKHSFERPRPCRADGVEEFTRFIAERCGRFGYFSAHAASNMALAILSGLLLKPTAKAVLPLMMLWAITVGYSRIYVGVHYPLDVISGFLIGGVIGFLIYRLIRGFLSEKLKYKF
ncbi:phosphatase PAP2 family protein [Gangjinia marincola]|uniref:Phosphatase PAP2 family protein n=1 Tax=Gangjinia marincola TaxID=578463 RepID=A0ABN1MDU7_9FLAO